MILRALRSLEQRLTFKPDRSTYYNLSGLPITLHSFATSTGRLSACYYRGIRPGVVLLSHGNTGNISFPGWHYEMLIGLGQSFFAYDYPGYGESEGQPSENALYQSGEAAAREAARLFSTTPASIVHFGISLGAAVSIEVASRLGGKGLILEAPFTSSRDVGKVIYGKIPVYYLVPDRFKNREKIGALAMPTLIVHGTNDPTIPYSMGRRLFDLAHEPKEFFSVTGAGHADVGPVAGSRYAEHVDRLLQRCC